MSYTSMGAVQPPPAKPRFTTRAAFQRRYGVKAPPGPIMLQTGVEKHEQEQAWKAEQAAAAAAAEQGFVDDGMVMPMEEGGGLVNGQPQSATGMTGGIPNWMYLAAGVAVVGIMALAAR